VVFDVVATIKQPIRGVAPMETEHYNLLEPSRHPQLCRPWHGVALSAVLALGGLAVLGAQSKWSSALAVDLASKEFLVSKELPLRAHGGGNSSSLLPVATRRKQEAARWQPSWGFA
ncbi:unnamed protein product, partial [Effrenium voratum]